MMTPKEILQIVAFVFLICFIYVFKTFDYSSAINNEASDMLLRHDNLQNRTALNETLNKYVNTNHTHYMVTASPTKATVTLSPTNLDNCRIAILMFCDASPNRRLYWSTSVENKRKYANYHGYSFIEESSNITERTDDMGQAWS